MKRRDYLTGLAGVGALGASGTAAGEDVQLLTRSLAVGDDTHHPGSPRFMQVGEVLVDPVQVDAGHGFDRDNLAPQIVGEPQRDAEDYDDSDFSWSVAARPDGSSAEIRYAAEPAEGAGGGDPYDVDDPADGTARWEPGHQNVGEFIPDVPGTYVLQLDAPDGTHEQTVHVFPEADGGLNSANHPNDGPPRLTLEVADTSGDTFVLEANVAAAPSSDATTADLSVTALADDRDALSTDDITVDGTTITVPKSALSERSRLHACPFDESITVHGMADQAVLDPDADAVELPNRPPEWIEDGVMYQMFTRSFAGPPEPGEWPTANSTANFANIADRVDYLADLGVDVVWLTPVVPSEGVNHQRPEMGVKYLGGGPHGYSALSYFEIAPDLGSDGTKETAMAEYESFIDACHDQDIKVCFDFVINHGGRHHPFYQDTIASEGDEPVAEELTYPSVTEWNTSSKYFDWFDRIDAADVYDNGDLVEAEPASVGFFGLRVQPNWDYSNVALREHILAAAEFWVDKGIDAFRCDIAWGVPHSFWRELRELVRAKDSEFMLLDETIPNRPHFAESEFDMHFDTSDFMNSAHAVAQGNRPAEDLKRSVDVRQEEGFPDHTLLANSIENHDESRTLALAQDAGVENPEKAQRAVWAAGVVLPGVPFVYYGQERQITNYGQERFDFDGSGEDPRTNDGDVGPGNPSRAFMNWDEYPEEHLQFYKDVIAMYHDLEILKPEYDLASGWFQTDDDVLVFGRKGDDDMQDAIVIVNPNDSAATVDVLPSVETTDEFTGSDIQTGTNGGAQTVEVDTLAVLRTDTVFDVGSEIAVLNESEGDDNGPGTYTYPTGDAYDDGVFDITGLSANDGGDSYQFAVELGGPLTNPDGLSEGFSAQHLQFYLRDPSQDGGASEGRVGTNVEFDSDYQYRVIADGANGVRVEDAEDNQIATGSVQTNAVEDVIVVEFPKSVLDNALNDHEVSALMCGYDPSSDGNVMQVESSAGSSNFGIDGGDAANAPNVIDLVAPENTPQSSLLDYDSDLAATLQYVPLTQPFTAATTPIQDETGDNRGPGGYELPTSGDFYDGVFDVERFAVYENRSRLRFDFTMATEVQNPFGVGGGWSHEFFQIYVRDEGASGDAPSGTAGRTATNVAFEQPYQYRVVAHGEDFMRVEDANGEEVSADVSATVDGDTIRINVPKSAVSSGDVGDLYVAPLIFPFDGYGAGSLRAFDSSAGDYTVGADDPNNAPKVMDMITPPGGASQSDILDYSGGTPEIPFTALGGGEYRNVTVATDPEGDNDGAGNLEFPSSSDFYPGAWDLRQFTLDQNRTRVRFTFQMEELQDPFGLPRGWSQEFFVIYIRDPDAGDDVPSTVNGVAGLDPNTEAEHHYRILVNGEKVLRIENGNGVEISNDIETSVDLDADSVQFDVPKTAIGGDPSNKEMAVLVCPFDGLTDNYFRTFQDEAGEFEIGAPTDAPKIMDMLVPEGTTQTDALTSAGFGALELPLATPSNLGGGDTGDGGDGDAPEVVSGSPARDLDGDGQFEDVNGDGTADLFDALDYYNNGDSDAVQNNVDAFDFDGDGDSGDLFDALELWNRIS